MALKIVELVNLALCSLRVTGRNHGFRYFVLREGRVTTTDLTEMLTFFLNFGHWVVEISLHL